MASSQERQEPNCPDPKRASATSNAFRVAPGRRCAACARAWPARSIHAREPPYPGLVKRNVSFRALVQSLASFRDPLLEGLRHAG